MLGITGLVLTGQTDAVGSKLVDPTEPILDKLLLFYQMVSSRRADRANINANTLVPIQRQP